MIVKYRIATTDCCAWTSCNVDGLHSCRNGTCRYRVLKLLCRLWTETTICKLQL